MGNVSIQCPIIFELNYILRVYQILAKTWIYNILVQLIEQKAAHGIWYAAF